jgi:DNA-directed RNA polymerase subunit RPC12/RpoP
MKTHNPKYHYRCTNCNKEYDGSNQMYLCPDCSAKNTTDMPPKGVLKTVYNFSDLKNKISGFDDLKKNGFIDLMPFENLDSLPALRVGNTPFYSFNILDGKELHLKFALKMIRKIQHSRSKTEHRQLFRHTQKKTG